MNSVEHITRLIAIPDTERSRDAEAYLASHPVSTEDIDQILVRLRAREPIPSATPLVACVYAHSIGGEDRAKALLGLYHLVGAWESDEENAPSAATVQAAGELLDQLAAAPLEEPDEFLRGRKYWLRLRRLIEKHAAPGTITEVVRDLARAGERSSWVWSKALLALRNWPHTSLLFPRDASFLARMGDDNRAYRELRKLDDELESAAVRLVDLAGRVPLLLHQATSVSEVLTDLGGSFVRLPSRARSWLFPADEIARALRRTDAAGRNRILSIVTADSSAEDQGRLRGYRDALASIRETESSTSSEEAWVDAVSLLSLDGTIWNLSPATNEETDATLLSASLELLAADIPERYSSSANTYRLYQMIGHLANALAASVGEYVGDPEITRYVPKLIRRAEPFVRLVGANLALLVARAQGDLSEYVESMMEELERDPVTSNGLVRGKDIDDDEYAVMDGVQRLTPRSDHAGQGDVSFSAEGLSAMLESCQSPMIAWRLAATLALTSQRLGDTSLRARLLTMKDKNDVIDSIATERLDDAGRQTTPGPSLLRTMVIRGSSHEPQQPDKKWDESALNALSTPTRATEGEAPVVHALQPGPLLVSEAREALEALAELPSSDWESWARQFAERHGESLLRQHQEGKGETIKGIFETDRPSREPEPFRTVVGSLLRLGYHPLAMGEGPFPGNPSAIDNDEYGAESIAYYRPSSCMTRDRRHQWGVFIRVPRFLRLLKRLGVPQSALFEPVLVHELFHHFVEEKRVELNLDFACDRFFALEEASANWYALQHLAQMQTNGEIGADHFSQVRDALFRPRSSGGLPGYGDYPLLDVQGAIFVPRLMGQEPEVLPADYRSARELLAHSDDVNAQRERRHWSSLLTDLASGEVPVYLDFLE